MSDGEDPAELYDRAREAAATLHAQAAEAHEFTKHIEEPTQDTPAWYAGTRARAALEQAEELTTN